MAAPFFLTGGKMTEQNKLSDLLGKKDSEEKKTPDGTDYEKNPRPQVGPQTINKTPSELAAETPEETANRYSIDNTVSDTDENNPRVEYSNDDYMAQVPSGTHLHPDIAKDMANRGISAPTTDIGQIRKGDTFVGFDFADEAVADVDSDEDFDEAAHDATIEKNKDRK